MRIEGKVYMSKPERVKVKIGTQSSSPQHFLVPATSSCHVVCAFHKQHSTRATSTTRDTRSTEQHPSTSQ